MDIKVKSDKTSTTFINKLSFGIVEDVSTTLDIICERYNIDCVNAVIDYKEKKCFKLNLNWSRR